mmetsp:Transcript_4068/g.10709  ORF Transcript_4068/g.10709 Transcript_4068/m.10709 type:complete len:207 (-) Transcript_4068:57-677(-)
MVESSVAQQHGAEKGTERWREDGTQRRSKRKTHTQTHASTRTLSVGCRQERVDVPFSHRSLFSFSPSFFLVFLLFPMLFFGGVRFVLLSSDVLVGSSVLIHASRCRAYGKVSSPEIITAWHIITIASIVPAVFVFTHPSNRSYHTCVHAYMVVSCSHLSPCPGFNGIAFWDRLRQDPMDPVCLSCCQQRILCVCVGGKLIGIVRYP